MRHDFDISDVFAPIDRIDAALDVAVEVLGEYGPDPGQSRIERLARFMMANIGGEPYGFKQVGSIANFQHDDVHVTRIGTQVFIDPTKVSEGPDKVANTWGRRKGCTFSSTPAQARAIAVMLLRAAELAEY